MISLDNSCFARMIFGKSVKAEFHSPFIPLLLLPVCSRQIQICLKNNLTLSDMSFEMFNSFEVEFCKLVIIRIDMVA